MEPGLTLPTLNWTTDQDRSLPYQSLALTPTSATMIYNNNKATLKITNSQPGEHHP
jgi:hypothetical protein